MKNCLPPITEWPVHNSTGKVQSILGKILDRIIWSIILITMNQLSIGNLMTRTTINSTISQIQLTRWDTMPMRLRKLLKVQQVKLKSKWSLTLDKMSRMQLELITIILWKISRMQLENLLPRPPRISNRMSRMLPLVLLGPLLLLERLSPMVPEQSKIKLKKTRKKLSLLLLAPRISTSWSTSLMQLANSRAIFWEPHPLSQKRPRKSQLQENTLQSSKKWISHPSWKPIPLMKSAQSSTARDLSARALLSSSVSSGSMALLLLASS